MAENSIEEARLDFLYITCIECIPHRELATRSDVRTLSITGRSMWDLFVDNKNYDRPLLSSKRCSPAFLGIVINPRRNDLVIPHEWTRIDFFGIALEERNMELVAH